ncbi:hypothetical protein D9756_009894 [Leucocoprinus leucothites]|uniref:Glycan binding protein Y3-like domain-containing protein n=1 Tax=Leucocoprinus leucothites TaxID=201217 RepID=A0A8H5CSN1_9AGAR|nr:hypothetical protein D9756_009894 [Leucoagaricus leucothites]
MFKAIILATLVGVTLARTPPVLTCATTGVGPARSCEQFICDFCSGVSQAEPVSNGESGGACYNLPSEGRSCLFSAFNSGNATGAPDQAACNVALWTVAGGCDLGGIGIMDWAPSTFTFSLKPRTGICSMGS